MSRGRWRQWQRHRRRDSILLRDRHRGYPWRRVLLGLVVGTGQLISSRKRARRSKSWLANHTKLVMLLHLRHDLVFLFQLHGAHPAESLFALNAFLLARLKDLLVLDAKLTSLDVKPIQSCDDRVCIRGLAEIGKCQSTKLSLSIQMIVKRVGRRDGKRCLQGDDNTSTWCHNWTGMFHPRK